MITLFSACVVSIPSSAPATITTNATTSKSTQVEVTAEALFTTYYGDNTVAADAEYKGKTIQVSGEATAIGYDSSGIPYIELSGGWPQWSYELDMSLSSMGVQCFFSLNDKSALAQLPLNQNVKIQGRCAGYDIDLDEDNVILDNCNLVK